MHKYLIELMKYTEDGATTNEFSYDTADTPQQLADKVSKWNKMRYTSVDEDGKAVAGNKMYKVVAKQGVYQDIADLDTFYAVNGCIVH